MPAVAQTPASTRMALPRPGAGLRLGEADPALGLETPPPLASPRPSLVPLTSPQLGQGLLDTPRRPLRTKGTVTGKGSLCGTCGSTRCPQPTGAWLCGQTRRAPAGVGRKPNCLRGSREHALVGLRLSLCLSSLRLPLSLSLSTLEPRAVFLLRKACHVKRIRFCLQSSTGLGGKRVAGFKEGHLS